jgi:hypothetical protein
MHHKDRDVSEGNMQSNKPDVIEAPGRTIQVPTNDRRVRYGTVGSGLDLGSLVWPKDHHVFSSQAVSVPDMERQLLGRPNGAKELGPAGGVKKNILRTHPVEVLLVDGIESQEWRKWIETIEFKERPRIILWLEDSYRIEQDREGPFSKSVRKKMQLYGYRCCSWFLKAEDYGAALVQERVAMVYFLDLKKGRKGLPAKPRPMGLPARAMRNLLMPVGVPRKAYCFETEGVLEGKRFLPCLVQSHTNTQPIYESEGPMPDRPHVWIRSDRGVRRLQHEELGKGKGVPSEWLKGTIRKPLKQAQVENATCIHLWTAAMDAIRPWLESEEETKAKFKSKEVIPPTPGWSTEGEETETEWKWEVPDLSEGGE